jgi:hypothetical protein
VLVLASFWRSRYTHGGAIFTAIGLYALAKVVEVYDGAVFTLTAGFVSGHTLKHLTAAVAIYAIVGALRKRSPAPITRSLAPAAE